MDDSGSPSGASHRILIVDDNPSIQHDFRKILIGQVTASEQRKALDAILDGPDPASGSSASFELDFASQGQEALARLRQARDSGQPFAMAFVDGRMPPGWDGVETIRRLWQEDAKLQVVICTAYSDYSWEETRAALGQRSDGLLILKKPFDVAEVRQLAHALCEKWDLARRAAVRIEEMEAEILARTQALRQSHTALREAHAETQALVNALPLALIGLDERACITYWNPVAESFCPATRGLVLGRPLADCPLTWDLGPIHAALERHDEALVSIGDVAFQRSDGSVGTLDVTVCTPAPTPRAPHRRLLLALDVSHKKDLERRLIAVQRMEALGLLAAGIAHEINTPTQVASDNLYFLRNAFRDLDPLLALYNDVIEQAAQGHLSASRVQDARASEADIELAYLREAIPRALAQTQDGLGRIAEIVRSMRQFSRPTDQAKQPVDINQTLQTTIALCRHEWKYVADIESNFQDGLPPVPGVPGQLGQVFLTLLVNAAHAVADRIGKSGTRGRIRASTRLDRCEVEVILEDDGRGLSDEIRHHVEQGLSMARTIVVDHHGGQFECRSTPGSGTTFVMRLPLGTG